MPKSKPELERGYQHDYSADRPYLYEAEGRNRKARTLAAVLAEHFGAGALSGLHVLDVGASTGIMDAALAAYVGHVEGIDIDESAIAYAQQQFQQANLRFSVADALHLPYPDQRFDVVVCAHVYEHVPDDQQLMAEIWRVLRSGGVCYFSAGNRFAPIEPHYNLPLLSWPPKWISDRYVRWLGRGDGYYERHRSYWGLKTLTAAFQCHDYTRRLVDEPERFHTGYMLAGLKGALARALSRHALWAMPGYIWLLERPKA